MRLRFHTEQQVGWKVSTPRECLREMFRGICDYWTGGERKDPEKEVLGTLGKNQGLESPSRDS